MATSFLFDGKERIKPGVFSRFQAQTDIPSVALAAGNVLIIDNGIETNFHGNSINGELLNGKDAVPVFTSARALRQNVRGGAVYRLSDFLFAPAGTNAGATSVRYINAATTTAADIAYTLTNGSFSIQTRFEGVPANGVLSGSNLSRGFAGKFRAGTIDPAAAVLELYVGGYRGDESQLSPEGGDIDGVAETDAIEELVAVSPEFTTVDDLFAWMQTDGNFNNFFNLESSTGTGAIVAADITGNLAFNLATGGTSTYATTDLDAVLDAIKAENIDYVLLLDNAANARSADNIRIVNYFSTESDTDASCVVGGYTTSATLKGATGSTREIAEGYNNEQVIPIHGGCFLPNPSNPQRNKEYNSLVLSAFYVGRAGGLAPQIPMTFKNVGVSGLTHNAIESDQEFAIQKGIVMFEQVDGSFDVVRDVNSLQNNTILINANATSYANSIVRIKRQVDKELRADLKVVFLKNPVGSNQFTTSPEAVTARVQKFLGDQEASPGVGDNLILSFRDVTSRVEADAIFTDYKIQPNGPIDFLFATGTIIN